ncbi:phage major capsid protein [Bacillus sp. AFS015802]|uniref:phage major capsid protein n=1 Tax=Bacillus sp. AFS015802 TaxID=2033486 RepID=UPI000BF9C5AB|nr:phage major capsid protein [Bacillus sp. AFS015802]PFA66855.1 phage major capsid protein [Bacillus sp. AFS015802]
MFKPQLKLNLQYFATKTKSIEDIEARLSEIDDRKKEIRKLVKDETRDVEYDKLTVELDELNDEVDQLNHQRRQLIAKGINDGSIEGKTISTFNTDLGDTSSRSIEKHDTKEYRQAFWNQIKSGGSIATDPKEYQLLNQPEVRSLSTATNQAGGYLVPAYWENTLVQKLKEANVMRQLATVLPMKAGDRKIPIVTDYGQAAWLDEGQAYPESDVAFDQILLGGYKIGRIIQMSEELMHDSVIDLDTVVADAFVKSFSDLEEEAFIQGDGTDRPTGVLGRAEVGLTGSEVDTITSDELYDLYYSLKRPYRSSASWLMNDQTVKVVRQLKTADGQYIWEPGFGNEPAKLLGRPVFTSSAMPVMGSGAKAVAFGDFSYYKIADRQGRVMQRLNEKYADVGRVGLRMFQRVDGNLALPEAVKVFENLTQV